MGAVHVLESVWLVGSGEHSGALTDRHDCHCYLIWDGSGGLLVDTGTGLGAETWLAAVAEVADPAALSGAVVTHYHADHAGGAAAAQAAGIPLLASAETAAALAVADESVTSLAAARTAGVYPADYRLRAATVDRVVGQGDPVVAGGLDLEILAAPGHCDGHLVVLLRYRDQRILFSGDCLFAGGKVSLQATHDCRLDQYAQTVITLAGLDIDVLLPGHGAPVPRDARVDIGAAAGAFRRLVPPPNFLAP